MPAAPRSAGRAPRMSRRANATWSALRTTRVVVGRSAADRVAVMGLRRMTLAEGFAETAGHPSCPSMGHPGRTHERPLRRAPRHSHFSFLDGASPPDDLVARAVTLGLSGLAVTDHQGLYGAVRFVTAAEAAGLHPVVGVEVELLDAVVPDPGGLVVPAPRPWRPAGAAVRRPREPPIGRSRDVPLGRARSGRGCPAIGRW